MLPFIIIFAMAFAYKELAYNPDAVRAKIKDILVDEKADDGNYGPFLVRLAWHCAGTYRKTDGRGGCDGARIRFDVERSWADNAALIPGPHEDAKVQPGDRKTITALELLAPIKYEFGNALSWGDLIVLAGSVALEELGGPHMDFCGGRVDAYEGYSIEELNVNMIYVNAGNTSADDVREKFTKMDMNDQETIALIGGGHAIGRCHASRSGFSGAWTSNPSEFSNEYFHFLTQLDYEPSEIAGQFETKKNNNTYIMLHGDYVLLDDEDYVFWLNTYAEDEDLFFTHFKAAWEKLMNRDMGLRPCAGSVPEIPQVEVDYDAVKEDVLALLPDADADFGTWGPLMVRLGWHCSGTYRQTDHIGGCNGARIRHDPEASWGSNKDVDLALQRLEPVYEKYDGLSWADLIIIASTTALESMGALPMPFCPGRTDVSASLAAKQSANLDPEIYLNPETATADLLRESMKIMGFTDRDMVVLNGGGHSIGQCHHFRSGFSGPWTHNPAQVSNEFFSLLLREEWELTTAPHTGKKQFKDKKTESLTMLISDLVFRDDDRFRAIVEEYAQDNDLFLEDFRKAWIKLVNADRFGDVCVTADDMGSTKSPEMKMPVQKDDMTEPIEVHCHNNSDSKFSTMVWVLVGVLFLVVVGQFYFMYTKPSEQTLNKEIEMMSEQIGGSIVDVKSI